MKNAAIGATVFVLTLVIAATSGVADALATYGTG